MIAPALAELGHRFPASDDEALALALCAAAASCAQRGFDFVPRDRERAEHRRAVARLDALWGVVQATFTTTPLARAAVRAALPARGARRRREAQDHRRAVRVLHQRRPRATARSTASKPKSLQRAEVLCRDIHDPRCRAWVAIARGFAFQNEGLLKPASLRLRAGRGPVPQPLPATSPPSCARAGCCTRARWRMLGQFDELALLRAVDPRRDRVRGHDRRDAAAAVHRAAPAARRRHRAGGARARSAAKPCASEGIGLTQMMRLAAAQLALYRDDGAELARWPLAMAEVGRSPLLTIRVWRSDFMLGRARALLGASQLVAERSQGRARRAEKVIGERGADRARVPRRPRAAAARGAAPAARRDANGPARRSTRSSTTRTRAATAGWCWRARSCARASCSAENPARRWSARALQQLTHRGAKEPVRFARLYSPGFDDPG